MTPAQYAKLGILAISLGFMAMTGCTSKKRPKQMAQGQGRDLYSVSDYDGRVFDLHTGGVIAASGNKTVKALHVKNEMGLEVFDLVSYRTQAQLVPRDLDFRAKPRHKYQIAYKVTDQYLKILKVAKKEDFDFSERTYAKPYKNGLLSVPLLGYPIQHIRLEQARNSDNEETNLTIEIPVQSRSQGTHIRFNKGRYVRFEALSKNDVYPASLFSFNDPKSVWYYKQTVVSATGGYEGYKGLWNNTDSDGFFTSKVRFIDAGPNKIQVISNEKAKGYSGDQIHNGLVLTIPAEFLDYKIAESGGEEGMNEVVDKSRHWQQARYVRLGLDGMTTENGLLGGQVQEVQITPNYFSVVIQHVTSDVRMRMRYSFLKMPKQNSYVPRVAHKEDLKKFGILNRPKKSVFYSTYNQQQQSDVEDQYVLTRFNPKKPVVFHISDTTKYKYRPIIHKAKDIWNDFLIRSGSQLRIAIAQGDSQLGDLRKNQIAIEESVLHTGFSGVSTSLVDSDTGEIISTIAQGQANSTRANIYNGLMNAIRHRLKLAPNRLGSVVSGQNSEREIIAAMKKLGSSHYYKMDASGQMASVKIEKLKDKAKGSHPQKNSLRALKHSDFRCQSRILDGAVNKYIDDFCTNEKLDGHGIEAYMASLQGQKLSKKLDIDKDFLERCTEKILLESPALLSTMVHEIGHSLGLDHNFMGSFDGKNFYKKGEIPDHYEIPRTSSIMDYFRMSQDRGIIPGKYDLAAIHYLYDEKVKMKNQEYKTIKPALSLKAQGLTAIHEYKFCNDEDVDSRLMPGCFRFDSGTTPLEIVKDTIQRIREDRDTQAYRYSNRYINPFPVNLYSYLDLKMMYDEYRNRLSKFTGIENATLTNFSSGTYKDFIQQTASQWDGETQSYFLAAQEIKKFLLDEGMFLLNKYCVFADNNKSSHFATEFEALSLLNRTEDCESSIALGSLSVQEVGYSVYPGFFEKNSYIQQGDQLDYAGFYLDRIYATLVLSRSMSFNRTLSMKNIAVAMVDEPDFREEVENRFFDRVLEGVQLPGVEVRFPLFSGEKDLITEMMRIYKQSMFDGNTIAQTMRRESHFGLTLSSSDLYRKMIVADLYDFTEQGQFIFGVRDPKYKRALQLVRRHKFLNTVLNLDSLDPEVVAQVREAIQVLPLKKDVVTQLNLRKIKTFYDKLKELELNKNDDTILVVKQFFDNRFNGVYTRYSQMYREFFRQLDHLTKKQEEIQATTGFADPGLAQSIAQLKEQNKIGFTQPVMGLSEEGDRAYKDFNQEALNAALDFGLKEFLAAQANASRYPHEVESQKDLLVETMILNSTRN